MYFPNLLKYAPLDRVVAVDDLHLSLSIFLSRAYLSLESCFYPVGSKR